MQLSTSSAPSLRLPSLLHCPEGFRPLAAAPEHSGASRQTTGVLVAIGMPAGARKLEASASQTTRRGHRDAMEAAGEVGGVRIGDLKEESWGIVGAKQGPIPEIG